MAVRITLVCSVVAADEGDPEVDEEKEEDDELEEEADPLPVLVDAVH